MVYEESNQTLDSSSTNRQYYNACYGWIETRVIDSEI